MTQQGKKNKKQEPIEDDGYATSGDLLDQSTEEEDYEIPGVGKVLIRGLNRDQAHRATDEDDIKKREMIIVQEGVVKPQLSWDDVRAWFKGPKAGQIQDLVLKLTVMSGIATEEEATNVAEFREEPVD